MPGKAGQRSTELDALRDEILDMWDEGESIRDIVEHFDHIKVKSGKRKGKNKVTPEYVAMVLEDYGDGIDYPITKTYIKRMKTEWRCVCANVLVGLQLKEWKETHGA